MFGSLVCNARCASLVGDELRFFEWLNGFFHVRRNSYPLADRIRRPVGCGGVAADGLRRTAEAGICPFIPGEAWHEALTQLEVESPRKAQLVKLRFFAGMTLEEAAGVLGVTVITAKRDWAAARVWLYRQVSL